jgi:RNA polymerase-binding transcription factor DksA
VADPTAHDDRPDEAPVDGGPDQAPVEIAPDVVDLDTIESELAGVDAALTRLSDGTYWTDEVTGEAIPDDVLARNPIARRA